MSPDGTHVYTAGDGDAVAVFSRNATTGELIFVEAKKDGVGGVDGLGNATEVTVSPNGERGYIASEADDAVAEFSRDAASGM